MELLCQRYGSLFIVVSRFFDGLRNFAGILVGSLEMPILKFALMTTLGATLWVGFWALGVYYLDEHIHAIAAAFRHLSVYTWIIAGALIVTLVLYLTGFGRRSG